MTRACRAGVGLAWGVWLAMAAPSAHAAPPTPAGPHPRIALTPAVLAALKAKAATSGTAVADAVAVCRKVAPEPGMSSGYQGDAWAFPASACALAWQVTRDPALAARGVKLWRALLEDVSTLGDRKACVPGASPEQARAAIERDTGYAIRFIGPHAALAYDWLHDAPGVDEALLRQGALPQTDFMSRQAQPKEVVQRAAMLPGVASMFTPCQPRR